MSQTIGSPPAMPRNHSPAPGRWLAAVLSGLALTAVAVRRSRQESRPRSTPDGGTAAATGAAGSLAGSAAPAVAPAPAAPCAAPRKPSSGPPLTTVVVAIHGIGNQRHSDTVRSVARRFGARVDPPLPVLPLGYFHIPDTAEVRFSRLDVGSRGSAEAQALSGFGFAEVFWADIPRSVVKAEDTLEETKAWATTVVSRAQSTYLSKVDTGADGMRTLQPADFDLAAGVIEEAVETVDVLENLLHVAALAGVFKFDLGPLLRDYLGDVQLVAEFSHYRQLIAYRFHKTMERIHTRFVEEYGCEPVLHIVAHSEGTVVSLLGLLQALAGVEVADPEKPGDPPCSPKWLGCVRGFMTIGSPIDKHLLLWPEMWKGLEPGLKRTRLADGKLECLAEDGSVHLTLPHGPIRWRNYYEFGDPIGFQLDTARTWLKALHCDAFEFERRHDIGFDGYWLPGKAHNDYWNDAEVFGHFITDVVLPDAGRPAEPGPAQRKWRGIVSTAVPYAAGFLLQLLAVFLLVKGVRDRYDGIGNLGSRGALQVLLLGVLLAGVTVAARLPRLVKTGRRHWQWAIWSALAWAVATVPYAACIVWQQRCLGDSTEAWMPLAALGVTIAVVATGWLPLGRRWGRRLLVLAGSALVLGLTAHHLWAVTDKPVWPLILAGAAFVYLWWLGILLFDLAFVWHRYIRHSVALRNCRAWWSGREAGHADHVDHAAPAAG